MSRINFAILVNDRPDLERAFRAINSWMASHSSVRFLALEQLATALRDIPAEELSAALLAMVHNGFARQVYRVKDPDGHVVGESYPSFGAIPATLPDRSHQRQFTVEPDEIISGFQLEPTAK